LQDACDAFFTDEGSVHDLVLPGCDALWAGEEDGSVVADAGVALAGLAVVLGDDWTADVAQAECQRRRRSGLSPSA